MNERLTDNEFHSKDKKERACYIQEPRLQDIYDKCFEYEDIDTNPTRLANIKKAFEIIKEHVLADTLFSYLKVDKTPNEWNWGLPKKMQLTQEEWDLLKKVLYEKETS